MDKIAKIRASTRKREYIIESILKVVNTQISIGLLFMIIIIFYL